MLSERIHKHKAKCWLVNTGWTGGPYGIGSRMKIAHTRAMVDALLAGELDAVEYTTDPIFRLQAPQACPGVPAEVLNPRGTWPDQTLYDEMAKKLAGMFRENFAQFKNEAPREVIDAAPEN
jgi:phosphoenolpyruvate carboxykinase (ATP)